MADQLSHDCNYVWKWSLDVRSAVGTYPKLGTGIVATYMDADTAYGMVTISKRRWRRHVWSVPRYTRPINIGHWMNNVASDCQTSGTGDRGHINLKSWLQRGLR